MTDMTLSPAGLIEIAEHEGIVPAPYRDSVGVWTWGIGHTAAAGNPDPARMHRAMPQDVDAAVMAAIDQFAIDVKGYVARVNAAIRVPLAQHQFDALVSFDFNTGGIHRAKLTVAINAGEPDAARHFMGWLRPPEIRKRRTAEMALFRTGDYAANGDAVPVWRTDGKGRLVGVLRTMSGAELLRRVKAAPIPAELPRMVDITSAVAAAARVRAAQEAAAIALAELEAALAA
jgi:lysozyme